MITLLDYQGNPHNFETREDIDYIDIIVISGDETAEVHYLKGPSDRFDAGGLRTLDLFDGHYRLNPELLKDWNELKDSELKFQFAKGD